MSNETDNDRLLVSSARSAPNLILIGDDEVSTCHLEFIVKMSAKYIGDFEGGGVA